MLRNRWKDWRGWPLLIALLQVGLAWAEELPIPTPAPYLRESLEEIHGYISPQNARPNFESPREAETITERYPNRAVRLQRQVNQDENRNYVNHGTWSMYDLQARVIAQGEYRLGKQVGPWMRIMSNFPPAEPHFRPPFTSQAEFEDGELNGAWTITDAQQRPVASWHFSQGQLHGVATTWYPTGQQQREMHFAHGVPDGDASAWKQDGTLLAKEFYRNGKQYVPVVTWHDQQQKESEGWTIRSNFTIHSNFNWWEGTVEITRVETSGEDAKTGLWTEWYPDGSTRYTGSFADGVPVGQHTWWHTNGQKMLIGSYKSGLAEGLWTRWHDNGHRHEEGTYLAGTRQGNWTEWSNAGQIVDVHDHGSPEELIADSEPERIEQHNVSHVIDGSGR